MYMSKITALLILLVAVVAFLCGAYVAPLVATTPFSLSKAADSNPGRYSLVVSPLKNEKFLVDTQTGKLWQIVKPGEATDKPFVCQSLDKKADNTQRLMKDKATKTKKIALKDKSIAQQLLVPNPTSSTTVEVISSGKVSKTNLHSLIRSPETASSSQLTAKTPDPSEL